MIVVIAMEDFNYNNNEQIETEMKQDNAKGFIGNIFDWLDSFVISLVVVVLLFTFVLGKVRVDGPSMMNTLMHNDQLIMSYFNYTPTVGDVVIVSRNVNNDIEKIDDSEIKPIVKRVIAIAGQVIEIKDFKVYVDGVELQEDYISGITENREFYGVHTIPPGCVFVMGDNRQNSHDSRADDIGMVDQRYIIGKVVFRISPFNRIRTF